MQKNISKIIKVFVSVRIQLCLVINKFKKLTNASDSHFKWVFLPPGEMGPMVASTLKLGIAILNGGNSTVQQVMLRYFTVIYIDCWIIAILSIFKCYLYKAYSK